MKHTYRLTCFFLREWKRLLLAGPLLAAVQLFYAYTASARAQAAYIPFETITERGVFHPLFRLVLMLTLAYALLQLHMLRRGRSRAVYSMLTLPGPRAAIPLGAVLALCLCVVVLALCQVLSLLGCAALWSNHAGLAIESAAPYLQTVDTLARIDAAALPIPHRANELFLVMLRAPLGRLLLPLTSSGIAGLLLLGLTLCASTVHFSCLVPRVSSLLQIIGEIFGIVLLASIYLERLWQFDNSGVWGILTLLAAADAALLLHSIHLYRTAGILP